MPARVLYSRASHSRMLPLQLSATMNPPHQVDLAPDLAPEERADQAEKVCLDAGLVPKY